MFTTEGMRKLFEKDEKANFHYRIPISTNNQHLDAQFSTVLL